MRGGWREWARGRTLRASVLLAVWVLAVACASGADVPPNVTLTSASTGANPAAPVTLTASGGQLASVRMTNAATGAVISGDLAPDRQSWHSTQQLGYDSAYQVDAVVAPSHGAPLGRGFTIHTVKPAGLAQTQLTPAPDAVAATGVGVGQPLVVAFTHAVTDRAGVQSHLRVTSTPPQAGAWLWMDDQHVHYRPQQLWAAGTTIDLDAQVYGADLGGGIYGAQDHHATYRVHDSWIARADGDSEQMTIYDNGAPVKTMPISMGKDATPTHSGIHVVSDKAESVLMDSCSFGLCSGPQAYKITEHWAVRISNDGEFVHQNPASVTAQGNSNVSHGCINLDLENAQWFFQRFGLGDVVDVVNSNGPPLPVWDTYGDWSLSWSQWQSGQLPAASGR
jgi:lipoprotein-anchoring transpeptidase ErfK/SrfK